MILNQLSKLQPTSLFLVVDGNTYRALVVAIRGNIFINENSSMIDMVTQNYFSLCKKSTGQPQRHVKLNNINLSLPQQGNLVSTNAAASIPSS
jgi:hypothetical protein